MVAMSSTADPKPIFPAELEPGGKAQILQTLIDIGRIITTSHGLDETLAHTVDLIAERMAADVCSIYLYDEKTQELVLKATHGLNIEAVGHVKMSVHEGLIGLVIEKGSTVNLTGITRHPRFKYFPSINEEQLSSFCGVPLIEFRKTLGVLAIQNREGRLFTPDEERLLIAISTQISGLISKAILVDHLQKEADRQERERRPKEPLRLEGVPIAGGVARDKVMILRHSRLPEPEYRSRRTLQGEKEALQVAIALSEQEILALIRGLTERVGEHDAAIFHSHLMFLEDRAFIRKIDTLIDQGYSAAWSVHHVVRDYLKTFQSLNDPYLKERGADLEDVGYRLLHHLGVARPSPVGQERGGILVSEILTPSDTAQLDPAKIKGIVTTIGGFVSHAAILARSLRIPAVSGIENLTELIDEEEQMLVDGEMGLVYVNPPEGVIREYDRYQKTRLEYLSHLDELRDVVCQTKDRERILLYANVSLPQDLEDFGKYRADGIALYRSELYYQMKSAPPTVDELTEQYGKAVKTADGKPVIFRTLDLGSDNLPPYLSLPREDNPFLGFRSIRYQLSRSFLLRDQLKAVLRVSSQGPVAVLFPMISQLEELHEIKRIHHRCREELESEGWGPLPEIKLGMMFEVPATVLMSELYAGELDFLAIGSNDLTQYTLAVDRNNPHVSYLYDPLDPAVLLMIQRLVTTARQAGKTIMLCGEMASDPEGCLVLVGMGLRELSMNAPLIPLVKDRLAQLTLAETENLARIAMNSTTGANVRQNIRMLLHQYQG
jgi:phosphotransferase system enzyme I (PtsP)